MCMDRLSEGWPSGRKYFSAILTNVCVMRDLMIVD